MGFFDSFVSTFKESYEEGKENYNLQQRWKKEEKEYQTGNSRPVFQIEDLVNGLNVASLQMAKRQIDLQIKYGDNSKEENKNLMAGKRDLQEQIEELKRKRTHRQEDADEEYGEFVDRYNSMRDKRIALCINYLFHPKATVQGRGNVLKIILKSPYCADINEVERDYQNLKERFEIYNSALENQWQLSALDYCLYNHLIIDAELIPTDEAKLGTAWWKNTFSKVMACGNTIAYNDEMYGTHFQKLEFYKLSLKYDAKIAEREKAVLSAIYDLYLEDKENP